MFDLQSDYNIVVGEHNELATRIEEAIEYIRKNFADIEYMKARYNEDIINKHREEIYVTDIEKLINILKGEE
ncbi:MAG: hypothetical protein IKL65_05615 [Bacilli bacterium]|nr:hypothetical protein [Bacilli bacterium]